MVIHGRTYRPSVASDSHPGFCSKMYSFPGPMALGVDGAAAEDGSEVEHVVLDPGAPVGGLEHVEAVDAARVIVIQPGAEDARPTQLAPVLVWHEIVRVVRAPAVIAEVAERRSGREAAHEHTVAPVRRGARRGRRRCRDRTSSAGAGGR